MRPLELALEGFTSFKQAQRLDFSQLDLFAITGPTGAGKSSLLDAMTFALFGTTLRTGKQDSELVSQGSSELKVQFRFAVRQSEYRITRTWRYRASTPESKVLLEHFSQGAWLILESKDRAVQKRVEEILGMDFDTFTRVILLPQGKFDEFLKGDAPKRRELLRQLAGLEIFERMRKVAGDRAKSLKAEREGFEHQLEAIAPPDDTELAAAEHTRGELENSLPGLSAKVSELSQTLAAQERLKEDAKRLEALELALEQLNEKAPGMRALAERLKQAQTADRLQGDWALVKEARTQLDTCRTAEMIASDRLVKIQAALEISKLKLNEALGIKEREEPALKRLEEAITKAQAQEEERLRLAQECLVAKNALSQKRQAHDQAELKQKEAERAEHQAKEALERAVAAVGLHSPGGDRLIALTKAAPLLSRWNTLKKQGQTDRKRQALLAGERSDIEDALQTIQSRLKQADSRLKDARSALEAAQEANEAALRHDHANALREGLKPTDDCPVCGQLLPEILPPSAPALKQNVKPLQEGLLAAENTQRGALTELTRSEAALKALIRQMSEGEEALRVLENEQKEAQRELEHLIGQGFEAEALEKERQTLLKSDMGYQEALNEKQTAQVKARELEQASLFGAKALQDARISLQESLENFERWEKQLQTLVTALETLTGGKALMQRQAELLSAQKALLGQLETAQETYRGAQEQHIQAQEAVLQGRLALQDAAKKSALADARWQAALNTANLDEATFLAGQANAREQQAWQGQLETHAQEIVRLNAQMGELRLAIGDRKTDDSTIASSREALKSAGDKLSAAQQELADTRAWLLSAQSKIKTAALLLTRLAESLALEQTFSTLARDLKSDEFQSYLLEHLQSELLARATVLLQELTENRYALRLHESEFWVEDNWNGGEKRRVRTLSGGETFATSLSMALALSEKLSLGAELGSLFLDEGFGTLDAETLENVTQILESLRQQNRLIGIITHVKALGERLPTQIKISKSPEGSRITVEAL